MRIGSIGFGLSQNVWFVWFLTVFFLELDQKVWEFIKSHMNRRERRARQNELEV